MEQRPDSAGGSSTARILGEAPEIRALRAQIERLAPFDAPSGSRVPTLLLHGETGAGKGLVASVVHDAGPRREGPFVPVNCAAIPENLLEAELFGYEAGSFTDAKRAKPGLFEEAHGGTLFLDEIDALPLGLQAKLLDAIERKRIRRLGAVKEKPVDVKIVAATKADLAEQSAQGRFRADLYHRLAVMVLVLPPLRRRRDDPVLLAEHFLAETAAAYRLPVKRLSPGAVDWLKRHRWPGNVRELQHLMERVTLLGSADPVEAELLERLAVSQTSAGPPTPPHGNATAGDERTRIRRALAETGGNVKRAAELMGLSRNALRYRMRKYAIVRAPRREPASGAPAPRRSDATFAAPAAVPSERTTAGARPSQTLLVGRDAELDRLQGWLARARTGERQLVFINGEAGIGKTALLDAFVAQTTRNNGVYIGRGQCVDQFGAGEPYMPVLEALGRLCRRPNGELVTTHLRRHAPTWLAEMPGLLDESERAALVQQVQGSTKERMLRELAEALEAITSSTPVLLAIEDLQWSDDSTLDLLSVVARRPEPARLLVVGTFRSSDALAQRPGLHKLQGELQPKGHCVELPLPPLPRQAVEAYLDRRFAECTSLPRLADWIHRRTAGTPLFMVNLADDLVQRGIVEKSHGSWVVRDHLEDDVGVPQSLGKFIDQRLGQLTSDEREVLEVASVVGDAFDAAAVAAGLERELEDIETVCDELARQRQLLTIEMPEQWPDGTVTTRYRFGHALYRETLYGQLPASRRARLHRRIGRRLEAAWEGAAGPIATTLAAHFEQGGDVQRGLSYLVQAAHNALRRFALQEAISHYRGALQLLERQPQSPERSLRELELLSALSAPVVMSRGYAAPEAAPLYARIRELLGELEWRPAFTRAVVGLWRFHLVDADFDVAMELAEQLGVLADQTDDQEVRLAAGWMRGTTSFFVGRCEAACQHLTEGLAAYDPERHRGLYGDDPGVACLCFGAMAHWAAGAPDQAVEWAQRAVALADELDYTYARYFARFWAGVLRQRRRELPAARTWLEEALELAGEHELGPSLHMTSLFLAWAEADPNDVMPFAERMEAEFRALEVTGQRMGLPDFLVPLAEVYALGGHTDRALAVLDRAIAMSHPSDYEPEAHRLKGEILSRGASTDNAHDEVEACFGRSLELARERGARSYELRASTSLARYWKARGRGAEARALLRPIVAQLAQGGDTSDLRDARRLLEELDSAG